MSIAAIIIRTAFTYLYLLAMVRLSGKRTVFQAAPIDLAISLILGDMIDDMLWGETPSAQFLVGAGGLLVVHGWVTVMASKYAWLRRCVVGEPAPLYVDGMDRPAERRRERINERALAMLLRMKGVDDYREIRMACLEPNGRFSLIRRKWARPATDREKVRLEHRERERNPGSAVDGRHTKGLEQQP